MLTETITNEIFTTNPDSPSYNRNNNVEVSYNAQTFVDAKHKLIVDIKVITKTNNLWKGLPLWQ